MSMPRDFERYRKRTKSVLVRLLDEERALLDEAAGAAEVPREEIVRNGALAEARRRIRQARRKPSPE